MTILLHHYSDAMPVIDDPNGGVPGIVLWFLGLELRVRDLLHSVGVSYAAGVVGEGVVIHNLHQQHQSRIST